MSAHHRRRRPRRGDRGASAVEFGLLMPVLFLLLFGIIDYGIWFADSISARQAVRDVARRGIVEDFTGCPSAGAGTADLEKLGCTVKANMRQISGTTYVKVAIAANPAADSPTQWATGATLRVCALTQHDSLLPLVPLPRGGITTTRVDMPIEQTTAAAVGARSTFADFPPPGANWDWCR